MATIRAAAPDDRARVERIVQAAYAPWVEVIGARPLPMDADYAALIDAGNVFVTGEGPDGLIVLVPEDGVLLVENVAVAPDRHGRGIGRSLLAFAEDHARNLGLPALRLYTNELMTRNIALYESLGYLPGGREDIGGRHVVHLAKTLD
ncbi:MULTISPECIES: GNAT family N-acetyltransferase [Actinomadura]|uniref:GNAT family N-acetyltransferase n=1 Tax=Actinomadura litoris TaxID=2678616 RepID=A0A7K1L7I7_9ACTN|nr:MULTISPECIES: GNAT family N-acetyltransferase [Actinomadura]MBT2210628.1 GNAT family N-acetyltransferase [Actinomadura sp. NEAU-AAG7]MUN40379.1 GNAT family N-acetyltransferase [Actinomadura litoris]